MSNIRNGKSSMVVTFSGPVQSPGSVSGTVSQASWDNRDMMPALRVLFHCQDDEIITAIEVDNYGLKAIFKRVPTECEACGKSLG